MLAMSLFSTTAFFPSLRILALDIFSLMCCFPGLRLRILPVAVTVNLFAAACRNVLQILSYVVQSSQLHVESFCCPQGWNCSCWKVFWGRWQGMSIEKVIATVDLSVLRGLLKPQNIVSGKLLMISGQIKFSMTHLLLSSLKSLCAWWIAINGKETRSIVGIWYTFDIS